MKPYVVRQLLWIAFLTLLFGFYLGIRYQQESQQRPLGVPIVEVRSL